MENMAWHSWRIKCAKKSEVSKPVFLVDITYFIDSFQILKKDQFHHWKLCSNHYRQDLSLKKQQQKQNTKLKTENVHYTWFNVCTAITKILAVWFSPVVSQVHLYILFACLQAITMWSSVIWRKIYLAHITWYVYLTYYYTMKSHKTLIESDSSAKFSKLRHTE